MATVAVAGLARGKPGLGSSGMAPVPWQPIVGGGGSSLSSVPEGIFLSAVGAHRCVKAETPAVHGSGPAWAGRPSRCPPPLRMAGSSGAWFKPYVAGCTRDQLAPPWFAHKFAERPIPVSYEDPASFSTALLLARQVGREHDPKPGEKQYKPSARSAHRSVARRI